MGLPGGEGDLAGTEVPEGAVPDLRGIPDDQRVDPSTGESEYTSPSLNMDGDWIRLEQRTRDEYTFSVFHNRFRRVRSPGRDDSHREEVARGEPVTRALGDGTCITEQEVTYETRRTEAWVLYQYYEMFRVDTWVEGYYEAGDDPMTSLGSAYGSAAAAPALKATVGVGVAQAVVIAGGAFIGTTQAMSELKGAAKQISSGWWPIMWYSAPASEQYDVERITVTETISVHPCDRPVTRSPADDEHNLLMHPGGSTTTPSGDTPAPDEPPPPADFPTSEGELPHEPDAEVAPEDMDPSALGEVRRPEFSGEGDDLRDPEHNQEADWYRDLGRRGDYYFVAQYLNQFREVRDPRFDKVEEDRFATNEIGRKALGNGMCVDVRKYGIVTFDRHAIRIDIAYKLWRVDSEEALRELKSSRYDRSWLGPSMADEAAAASGHSSTASAATGTAGAAAGAAEDLADAAGQPIGSGASAGLNAAGHALGGISTTISVASMESAVQVGAGWSPVGYFYGAAEMRPEEEFRWVQEGEPYPCPGHGADVGDDGLHEVGVDGLALELTAAAAGIGSRAPEQEVGGGDDGGDNKLWGWLPKWVAGLAVAGAATGGLIGIIAATGGSDDGPTEEVVDATQDQDTEVVPAEPEPPADENPPAEEPPVVEAQPDPPADPPEGDGGEDPPTAPEPSPEQARLDGVALQFGVQAGSLGYMPDVGPVGFGSRKGEEWTVFTGMSFDGYSAGLIRYDESTALAFHDQSVYPCGARTDAYVVTCPAGAGKFGPGEAIIVVMDLDAIGGEADTTYTYGLAFDDDGDAADNYPVFPPFDFDLFLGTELWYRLVIEPDGTRRMWADAWAGDAVIPRYSAAVVIEMDDTLVWIIPRAEVPGDQLEFRGTAFADRGDGPIPEPTTAGADVTGTDPESPLMPIDTDTVVDVVVGEEVPPDFGGPPIERVAPPDDPETHIANALAAQFVERAAAALESGDEEQVLGLLHPGLIAQFGRETCLAFVRATIGQAIGYEVTGDAMVVVSPGFVFIQVPSMYSYPTGDVPSTDGLVSTNDGGLGFFFDCTAAG